MSALPELMRRLDRKLDIQRGLSLSYDDLALLVASGAYAKLQEAAEDEARRHDMPRINRKRGTLSRNDPFIYFIRAGEAGPIKIGLTRSVVNRCASLQISAAETLIVLATVHAPKEAERQLHAHFAPERIRGEWFRPSPRLLAYVDSLQ